MELSPFSRIIAFAAAVLILAGLGVYLFLPQRSAAGSRGPAKSPSASPSAPGGSPGQGPGGPGGTASPGPGAPDIYQWLPFSQVGLASAAKVTTEFADDYGTFSSSESTAGYLAPMKPLVTSQLAQVIGRAFAAPGLAATRVASRQVSAATAAITSLRAFGPTSLTFVVTITARITDSKGHSQQTTDYAVTVTGNGTSWQVSDIELAVAGNQ